MVVVDGSPAFEAIESTMATNPLAATALATLLRGAAARTVTEGLLAESAVYSALQAGPEFARLAGVAPAARARSTRASGCGSSGMETRCTSP